MFMVGVTDYGLENCAKGNSYVFRPITDRTVQEDYNEHSWTPIKSNFKPPAGFQ